MRRNRRVCVYPNLIGLVDGGNSLFAEKNWFTVPNPSLGTPVGARIGVDPDLKIWVSFPPPAILPGRGGDRAARC